MTRVYSKTDSVCVGTCGRVLSPRKRGTGKSNEGAYRHAKGRCWPCYRDCFSVVRHEPDETRVRWARNELAGIIARRHRLGIPEQGRPIA
jgi:hypothetical protein